MYQNKAKINDKQQWEHDANINTLFLREMRFHSKIGYPWLSTNIKKPPTQIFRNT